MTRALVRQRPRGGELLEQLEQLPAGNYRVLMTVTKIRRRRGIEVAATPVVQQVVDLKLRRRALPPKGTP